MKNHIYLSIICKFTVAIVWLLTVNTAAIHAAETTFSWLPNSESEISGYRIQYGESAGDYTNLITIDSPQIVAGRIHATLQDLDEETTYYAVITAYNSTLESPLSNEISWTTDSASGNNAPPTPRIISVREIQ